MGLSNKAGLSSVLFKINFVLYAKKTMRSNVRQVLCTHKPEQLIAEEGHRWPGVTTATESQSINIVIKGSDKGGAVVVLNSSDYIKEALC